MSNLRTKLALLEEVEFSEFTFFAKNENDGTTFYKDNNYLLIVGIESNSIQIGKCPVSSIEDAREAVSESRGGNAEVSDYDICEFLELHDSFETLF